MHGRDLRRQPLPTLLDRDLLDLRRDLQLQRVDVGRGVQQGDPERGRSCGESDADGGAGAEVEMLVQRCNGKEGRDKRLADVDHRK